MKLITEYVENDLEVIAEQKRGGEKSYVISGVFMQSNTHFWARGGYLIILPIPSRKQTASSQQPRH